MIIFYFQLCYILDSMLGKLENVIVMLRIYFKNSPGSAVDSTLQLLVGEGAASAGICQCHLVRV